MDASQINHALNLQFHRYDYRLNNSFIFSWESDFLCLSSGGYWVECEVKVTRSDFFRDFDKPKHKLFETVRRSGTHFVQFIGNRQGDLICQYRYGVLFGYHDKAWDWATGKYYVNDHSHARIRHITEYVHAPASGISITPMAKVNCPHQFYFTVPAGLVKLEEVPDYAGLIEIKDGYCEIVRRAPYLHKTKMDLTKILLKKYYNLWQYRSGGDMDKYYECVRLKLF